MAICFHSSGTIRLNTEKKDEFLEKFLEMANKYDGNTSYMCNDKGIFQFIKYARHGFMSELTELLKNNIDLIDSGRLRFACNDEDGSVKNPFPYYVEVEIADGQVFEEIMHTRLPYDWDFLNIDDNWFETEYKNISKIQPLM